VSIKAQKIRRSQTAKMNFRRSLVIAYLIQYVHQLLQGNLTLIAVIGLIGQALFTARFIVQWIASERAGRSVVPLSFWYLSLSGGFILLGYALYKQDLVFILGQAFNSIIYVRNLMLLRKTHETESKEIAST
jgi:lipid-A-disaccharide synthase-like uncharacterized protein